MSILLGKIHLGKDTSSPNLAIYVLSCKQEVWMSRMYAFLRVSPIVLGFLAQLRGPLDEQNACILRVSPIVLGFLAQLKGPPLPVTCARHR